MASNQNTHRHWDKATSPIFDCLFDVMVKTLKLHLIYLTRDQWQTQGKMCHPPKVRTEHTTNTNQKPFSCCFKLYDFVNRKSLTNNQRDCNPSPNSPSSSNSTTPPLSRYLYPHSFTFSFHFVWWLQSVKWALQCYYQRCAAFKLINTIN